MKKRFVVSIVMACSLFAAEGPNGAPNESPRALTASELSYQHYFKQADSLMGKYQFQASIQACENALQFNPKDYLVHAIMCLDYYEIAEVMDVKKQRNDKIAIYEKIARIAAQGIENAPQRGECYFFRGLAHARLTTTNGILYGLFRGKGVENDWLRAVQCTSEYITPNGENLQASTCIALGSYYRLCPSFFLLRIIFGISGDIDKSVDFCKRAYQLDPRIEITKEYGISLITRGISRKNQAEIEQGKNLLRLVPTLRKRLRTDAIDIEHSKILLDNIKLCPDYSRDQQQDISEESYMKTVRANGTSKEK